MPWPAWPGASRSSLEADVLGELADDLLYHGDLHAALRRALQGGLTAGGQIRAR